MSTSQAGGATWWDKRLADLSNEVSGFACPRHAVVMGHRIDCVFPGGHEVHSWQVPGTPGVFSIVGEPDDQVTVSRKDLLALLDGRFADIAAPGCLSAMGWLRAAVEAGQ